MSDIWNRRTEIDRARNKKMQELMESIMTMDLVGPGFIVRVVGVVTT